MAAKVLIGHFVLNLFSFATAITFRIYLLFRVSLLFMKNIAHVLVHGEMWAGTYTGSILGSSSNFYFKYEVQTVGV